MGAVVNHTWRGTLVVLLLSLLLSACDTPATPVAAVTQPVAASLDTTAAAVESSTPPLRYGIPDTTRPYLSDSTLSMLRGVAEIAPWSADTDPATFDIIAGYGTVEGWQVSAVSHQMHLLINADLSPLNNVRLREMVQEAIDPAALTAPLPFSGVQTGTIAPVNPALLRTELANLGYPDGFRLTLAYTDSPGIADALTALRQQLINSNLETVPLAITPADVPNVLSQNRAHLVLAWVTQSEQVAQWTAPENVSSAVLYTLPIGYTTRENIAIEFTADGWPLPAPAD